jgi:DNA-binding PadR family transcriptional regulator
MTAKERQKIYNAYYRVSKRGKAARRKYAMSEKGRASARRCRQRWIKKQEAKG